MNELNQEVIKREVELSSSFKRCSIKRAFNDVKHIQAELLKHEI